MLPLCPALRAEGVHLVNEDDGWGVQARQVKEAAHLQSAMGGGKGRWLHGIGRPVEVRVEYAPHPTPPHGPPNRTPLPLLTNPMAHTLTPMLLPITSWQTARPMP